MRRLTLNFSITIVLAMVLFLVTGGTTHAANNGHITGKLLDGTNKNAPLAGQKVTLQMAQGPNGRDLTSSTTDASGAYTFPQLATDKTISYAVYIRYQGAQYVSDVISLADKPEQQLNLTVYQATSGSAKLAIVHTSILIHQPDPKSGTITISEVHSFKNLDTHSYVGSLDASKGKPNALMFSLPSGASNIKLGDGFAGYQQIQVDSGFATDVAVLPGDTEFSFSFTVPYRSTVYDFAYTAMYPTIDLSVLVPPSIQANSGALNSQSVVNSGGQSYRVFDTKQLLSKQAIHVNLSGLPAANVTAASAPTNTSWLWLVVGLLIMVGILLLTALISRFQSLFSGKRRSERHSGKRRHHSSNHERKSRREEYKSGSRESVRERKEELLRELLEIDKDFGSGKIDKKDYLERRSRTKSRLRDLIGDDEAARR